MVTLDGKKIKVVKAKEDSKNSLKLINDTLKEKMREISKMKKKELNKKLKKCKLLIQRKLMILLLWKKANLDKILKAKKRKEIKTKRSSR